MPDKQEHWSQHATNTSDMLDLERDVFALSNPREIAASLKESAEASARRKDAPYQSAMSMLDFYINRAGKNAGTQTEANAGGRKG